MTRRPRLLDAFCGEGGAGMGYHRAGFDVVGVDLDARALRRYPFPRVRADAVWFIREHGHEFDAIHASPPCQHYAPVTRWRGKADDHPDLVAPTRDALDSTGRPWIIENVPGAPIRPDFILCGTQHGLTIRRHRWFETSWRGYTLTESCRHDGDDLPFGHKGERAFADAMDCRWMTNLGGRQAIPPAFTEFLGAQLIDQMRAVA